jgi:hypothetical protein
MYPFPFLKIKIPSGVVGRRHVWSNDRYQIPVEVVLGGQSFLGSPQSANFYGSLVFNPCLPWRSDSRCSHSFRFPVDWIGAAVAPQICTSHLYIHFIFRSLTLHSHCIVHCIASVKTDQENPSVQESKGFSMRWRPYGCSRELTWPKVHFDATLPLVWGSKSTVHDQVIWGT